MDITNLQPCDIPPGKAQIESWSYLELQAEYWKLTKHHNLLQRDFKKLRKRIVEVDGWKGIGSLKVVREGTNWLVKEYHKVKTTGEVKERNTVVSELNVANLWLVMKKNCYVGEYYTCHDIAEFLGYKEWEDLWKEREKYFKEYYYPLKVLEGLNFIEYASKSKIRMLRG